LPERVKVAEFYSARSETITLLPWSSFAPPITFQDASITIQSEGFANFVT
jgi:hypothetical protein